MTDWHCEDEDKMGRALVAACEQACKDNAERAADAAVFARLVDGRMSPQIGGSPESSPYHALVLSTPIFRNTAQSVYKTANAKIAGLSEDLPQLQSTGGDFKHMQAAVKFTRWLAALYTHRHGAFANLHALARQAFAISQVTGSAAVFPELYPDGRIECNLDNTLSMGIQRSGEYGRAISLVRTRRRARVEAVRIYGEEHEEAIKKAPHYAPPGSFGLRLDNSKDEVAIYEGWCMADDDDSPGFWLHVLADGTVLDEGDHDAQDLPCALFHCYESTDGGWGVPMIRHVIEACLAENEMMADFIHGVRVSSDLIATTDSDEVHKKLEGLSKVVALKL